MNQCVLLVLAILASACVRPGMDRVATAPVTSVAPDDRAVGLQYVQGEINGAQCQGRIEQSSGSCHARSAIREAHGEVSYLAHNEQEIDCDATRSICGHLIRCICSRSNDGG